MNVRWTNCNGGEAKYRSPCGLSKTGWKCRLGLGQADLFLEDRMEIPARPWASRYQILVLPFCRYSLIFFTDILFFISLIFLEIFFFLTDIGFSFLQIFFFFLSDIRLSFLQIFFFFLSDTGFIFLQIFFLLSDKLFIFFANILSF